MTGHFEPFRRSAWKLGALRRVEATTLSLQKKQHERWYGHPQPSSYKAALLTDDAAQDLIRRHLLQPEQRGPSRTDQWMRSLRESELVEPLARTGVLSGVAGKSKGIKPFPTTRSWGSESLTRDLPVSPERKPSMQVLPTTASFAADWYSFSKLQPQDEVQESR